MCRCDVITLSNLRTEATRYVWWQAGASQPAPFPVLMVDRQHVNADPFYITQRVSHTHIILCHGYLLKTRPPLNPEPIRCVYSAGYHGYMEMWIPHLFLINALHKSSLTYAAEAVTMVMDDTLVKRNYYSV